MVNMADFSTRARSTLGRCAAILVLVALSCGGCAIGPTFHMTPQDQIAAEEWAISVRLMGLGENPAASGPTAPHSEWQTAVCRWTWTAQVARCETRSRPASGGAWVSASRRFKLQGDETWELLVP